MADKEQPKEPPKPAPNQQPQQEPKPFTEFPRIDTRERIEKSEPPGEWSDKQIWPNE